MEMSILGGLYMFCTAAAVDAICAPEIMRRYRAALKKEAKINARGAIAVLPVVPVEHVNIVEERDIEIGKG